jgi:hypothetical protein
MAKPVTEGSQDYSSYHIHGQHLEPKKSSKPVKDKTTPVKSNIAKTVLSQPEAERAQGKPSLKKEITVSPQSAEAATGVAHKRIWPTFKPYNRSQGVTTAQCMEVLVGIHTGHVIMRHLHMPGRKLTVEDIHEKPDAYMKNVIYQHILKGYAMVHEEQHETPERISHVNEYIEKHLEEPHDESLGEKPKKIEIVVLRKEQYSAFKKDLQITIRNYIQAKKAGETPKTLKEYTTTHRVSKIPMPVTQKEKLSVEGRQDKPVAVRLKSSTSSAVTSTEKVILRHKEKKRKEKELDETLGRKKQFKVDDRRKFELEQQERVQKDKQL